MLLAKMLFIFKQYLFLSLNTFFCMENPIFGPNFLYSLLRPNKKQIRNNKKIILPNKISRACALKFHSIKIFKVL
jgi:hypothetical protein